MLHPDTVLRADLTGTHSVLRTISARQNDGTVRVHSQTRIFAGEKIPSRDKLIALAFGLRLSEEETIKLLKISGNRELYARDERDALILFALYHK